MGKVATQDKIVTQNRKGVQFSSYISKIAKQLSLEDPKEKRLTISGGALAEVELLVEHAVKQITSNAAHIIKYSGQGTLGVKAAAAATNVAFSGPLSNDVRAAGERAVAQYEKSLMTPVAAPA